MKWEELNEKIGKEAPKMKSEKRSKANGDDEWENEDEDENENESRDMEIGLDEAMGEGLADPAILSDKLAETEIDGE